jgi:cytochrome oxidase Cu insertion factor (SCO1/SenC/PrrC family)
VTWRTISVVFLSHDPCNDKSECVYSYSESEKWTCKILAHIGTEQFCDIQLQVMLP